jgi:DNA-binding transcriptional ArsR family regulator
MWATDPGARDAAPLFAALGDPLRLELLARLREGPRSVADLSRPVPVSRQAVSKHLEVLREAGLAQCRKRGRESLWEARPQGLEQARYYLDRISRRWDEALERLRLRVEDD